MSIQNIKTLLQHSLFAQTLSGILLLLIISSTLAWLLKSRARSEHARALFDHIIVRINAWWVMAGVLAVAFYGGLITTVVLFFVLSIIALREFLRLIPLHDVDKRLALLAFCVFTPLQYWLVYDLWYGMFAILIPVYAFMVVPFVSALAGDTKNFLARTANFQWALMLCVYSISYLPALLMLPFTHHYADRNIQLILYFVIVVQLSDVLQFIYGKLLGKHALAPNVSPNKTWEGLVGGITTATLLGVFLRGLTPFSATQAAVICLVILTAGFAGGLCMSAIKRDRGVKDFGNLIQGHGGVLDRLDSVVFSAPLFFHICRYWFLNA